ncbi:isoprenyl transferase [Clostridium formicaceticum]|uniref:Isoprenyl transferase n=1 Tax=Clostridium formicaceticum TaxID=1497 RepID=A0AAC9WHM0_9CLOT|nr:isoprenyl transferase [Clostridium formicaceticum]AOY77284.1 isoprenyl transferase [Clostridium formicaceticum]ARE87825.1 Ditrans,polycis-undecaprenyl-diphosphate synthase ((2E,6E)-farnesyl-diphosphate specific) [Clostridium formicaceticum]
MNKIKDMIKNKNTQELYVDKEKIPQHIGIIMDGNGRWAKKRNLPRTLGHRSGVNALRDVIKTASNIGVKYLSLYAFSTENWKRSSEEVSALMKLLVEYLKKEAKELHKNNVKINTIGDITKFPEAVKIEIHRAKELTKNNKGLCVNIALNYGSRDEMVRCVKKIAEKLSKKQFDVKDIDENLIKIHLDTGDIPDPDLLIRTSGEYRLSNFLLWQSAYTELWFSDVYWPDFTGTHLLEAIKDFENRQRRYGGT